MPDYSQPILPGRGATDYERYLRTDDLLSLQKTPAEMAHRDELLFQTVHQSSELWLKLACFEVETATARVHDGDLGGANRLLRRAVDAMDLVIAHLQMLDHLSPWEYHTFRKVLGHGAGFDSPGFRRIHAISPALGTVFHEQLERAAISLVTIYQESERYEALFQLAERLVDWDERVTLWKYHHLKLVQRVIGGHVIGTHGTPVEVLAVGFNDRFYPDLWDLRDELTRLAGGDAPGHSGR